ncbi:MAG: hypothetical protein IKV43_02930 [Clostridia bacterium]|nr:hypothetical protein [Clostridia bacterium]
MQANPPTKAPHKTAINVNYNCQNNGKIASKKQKAGRQTASCLFYAFVLNASHKAPNEMETNFALHDEKSPAQAVVE